MESLDEAPQLSSFTALVEHEEATPSTFFGGKAVLHAHVSEAVIYLAQEAFEKNELLQKLKSTSQGNEAANGTSHEYVEIDGLEIWVTSADVKIWSTQNKKGIQILYPFIALHAIGPHPTSATAKSVMLQLNLEDVNQADPEEDLETIDLYVVPLKISPDIAKPREGTDDSPVRDVYDAVTACSMLHPDPQTPGEDDDSDANEDGIQQISLTGGNWITSENMHDFFDEDGNYTGPEILGPGAGHVRSRDDVDDEEDKAIGSGDEIDSTKWHRTD